MATKSSNSSFMSPTPEKNEIVNTDVSVIGSTSITHAVNENSAEALRVYKRRWLILALFVLYSSSNAFQWVQYTIIFDIVTNYYNVAATWVDWTSLIYMFVYIPLIWPATFLLEKKVK